MQTPAAMHRAALYKGVNLSPLLSSSFPISLLLPFAPQQSCPGPFHRATLTVNTGTDQKTKEYIQLIPEEKKCSSMFPSQLIYGAALPLMALPCSKLSCCFLQSFTFKDEVPRYHISPSPLSPTLLLYNPTKFGVEGKQLVRRCYGWIWKQKEKRVMVLMVFSCYYAFWCDRSTG